MSMKSVHCIEDLRQLARRKVPKAFFEYADGGSYSESTLRANTADLESIRLRQRVMVLNVWPRQLPALADEVQADRKRYLQHDPAGKVSGFAVRHPAMPCQASVYQGSDHVDDVLVFCDPGAASGVRLSWSMAFDDADPSRRALLDGFMRVVVASRWMKDVGAPPAHGH